MLTTVHHVVFGLPPIQSSGLGLWKLDRMVFAAIWGCVRIRGETLLVPWGSIHDCLLTD